jgi:phosphoribosylamine---glycine ligase
MVIEFNARFGDPETQVLMPRIHGDFAGLLKSCAEGAMDLSLVTLSSQSCVGVVLATRDYPRSSTPLTGLPIDLQLPEGAVAFWGGSSLVDGKVKSGGGRVLTVSALGETIPDARAAAYEAVKSLAKQLGSAELSYRTDIASLS